MDKEKRDSCMGKIKLCRVETNSFCTRDITCLGKEGRCWRAGVCQRCPSMEGPTHRGDVGKGVSTSKLGQTCVGHFEKDAQRLGKDELRDPYRCRHVPCSNWGEQLNNLTPHPSVRCLQPLGHLVKKQVAK